MKKLLIVCAFVSGMSAMVPAKAEAACNYTENTAGISTQYDYWVMTYSANESADLAIQSFFAGTANGDCVWAVRGEISMFYAQACEPGNLPNGWARLTCLDGVLSSWDYGSGFSGEVPTVAAVETLRVPEGFCLTEEFYSLPADTN